MSTSESRRLSPGEKLDFYTIIRAIGAGGMGAVYLAEDERLKRKVALKVIDRGELGQNETINRFLHEARILAQLQHPNVINIFGIGEVQNHIYIAMEYVDGASLHQLLRQGRLSMFDALNIIKQIAEGLSEAHRIGLIHRDIKPANILVDSTGRAKLIDFGIAKQVGDVKGFTETGMLIGTLNYMAPELFRSQPASPRSDFYALGLVLYEAIVFETPFAGSSQFEIMENIRSGILNYPIQLRPLIPDAIIKFIEWATHNDPARRPISANAFAQEASKLLRELPQLAPRFNRSILQSIDSVTAKATAEHLKAVGAAPHIAPLAHLLRKKDQTLEAFIEEYRSGVPTQNVVAAARRTVIIQNPRRIPYTAKAAPTGPSGRAIAIALGTFFAVILIAFFTPLKSTVERRIASIIGPTPVLESTLAPGAISEPPVGQDPWPPIDAIPDPIGTVSIGKVIEFPFVGSTQFSEVFIRETLIEVTGDFFVTRTEYADKSGVPTGLQTWTSRATLGGWAFRLSYKNSPFWGDADISYDGDPSRLFPLRQNKTVRFDSLIRSKKFASGTRVNRYCKIIGREPIAISMGRFNSVNFNCWTIGSLLPPERYYFSPELNYPVRTVRYVKHAANLNQPPGEVIWELQKLERPK